MKYLSFLFLLILKASLCYAQTHAEKKFIRFAIGKEHILYFQKVGEFGMSDIKEALSKDTIYRYGIAPRNPKTILPDSMILILTPAERKFVCDEFDKMKDITWKDNLFKHSIIATSEKLKKYKEEHRQSYYDSQEFRDSYRNIYTFTKPVFIRNKTMCFFYLANYCGMDCAGGKLMIYIKEKGRWRVKYTPFFWVS